MKLEADKRIYLKIQKLLDDLGWEFDRMTSSGQETLEELWKIFGMKTFEKDSWEGETNE